MPLSEEEQRLLEQMEQALAAEDPKFASTLRGSALVARSRRQALLAALVFLVGVVVLMTGAVGRLTLVAVVGFLLMLGSAYACVTALRRAQRGGSAEEEAAAAASRRPAGGRAAERAGGSFMSRMEERWRRRRDDDEEQR
ncbi:MAG: DUF3040 domain-containing protein [Nocardioidaceae bacterium]